MACRDTASEKGCGAREHQRSTAWSTARMPEERKCSAGVSSVAAGSSTTAFGTMNGSTSRCLRPAARSVTPACGANSAADSVVGTATMRGTGRGAPFWPPGCV